MPGFPGPLNPAWQGDRWRQDFWAFVADMGERPPAAWKRAHKAQAA